VNRGRNSIFAAFPTLLTLDRLNNGEIVRASPGAIRHLQDFGVCAGALVSGSHHRATCF